ncbi:MAG: NfeD family protein [Treponema sp.]|jgi:membrane-bound serine protease (ClpP class)|nr:NfeD family protein [Treponema sp.]
MKENDYSALIGKIAVTDTPLEPLGTVLIDGEIYEARTDAEFVDAGRGVKITRVKGNKIFVRRV